MDRKDADFRGQDFNKSDRRDKGKEGDKLSAEYDPRLADVWLAVFTSEVDFAPIKEQLGWFLRMAYLRGYEDALEEPIKGQLYRRLGVKAPSAPDRKGGRP